MKTMSLQAKTAYFARVRQSNYAASLRLEGFTVVQPEIKPTSGTRSTRTQPLPTRRKV